MDASRAFAENAFNMRYENLPQEVVEGTKKSILDTLGVILAASTLGDGVREIVDLVKDAGGKEESSIIASGKKVPCWMAAFANGSMIHAIDYDDIHDEGNAHPTGNVLVGSLAAVERAGKVTGKELITAVALGTDMANRIGMAIIGDLEGHGFIAPSVIGYFSSGLAAGKILRLSREDLASALGLAMNQAAGSMAMCFDPKTKVRAIRDAFCSKGGVLAAVLAHAGVTGISECMEGRAGLFKNYFGGEYNPAPLMDNLGKRFEGLKTSFKPWPSCRTSHTYIHAALSLVKDHDLRPENIEDITVVVGDTSLPIVEPLAERRRPLLGIGAKNSLPFLLGIALTRRTIVLKDFLKEGLNDPAVLDMAQRVNYRYDRSLKQAGEPPAIVEIKTRGGQQYTLRVDRAYGNPQNPIKTQDLIAKFKDCTSYSAKPLSANTVDNLIDTIQNLENVADIREIIKVVG